MSPEEEAFEEFTDPIRPGNDNIEDGSFPDPDDYWGPGGDDGGSGYEGWLPPEDQFPF